MAEAALLSVNILRRFWVLDLFSSIPMDVTIRAYDRRRVGPFYPYRAKAREALMASVDIYRAVRSPALDAGRYRHSACTNTEIFNQGRALPLCSNASCPNKGANWILKEKFLDEITPVP